ncbi:MAG: VanZ family protein [Clostridia bacterium]|nr:VanZ family protein [Clostridia bacterium]
MEKAEHSTRLRALVVATIVLFSLVLVWVIYFKFGNAFTIEFNHYQLHQFSTKERFLLDIIPFKISRYHSNSKTAIIEILLNGLVMAPFGILFNIIDKKPKIFKHIIIVFCISLTFEVVQFCTLIGGFNTTDLIMNTLGYFIGLAIYRLIIKNLSERVNMIIFTIANAILVALLVYATITIIEVWDILEKILSTNHFKILPLE